MTMNCFPAVIRPAARRMTRSARQPSPSAAAVASAVDGGAPHAEQAPSAVGEHGQLFVSSDASGVIIAIGRDSFGNWCSRMVAQGQARISASSLLNDLGAAETPHASPPAACHGARASRRSASWHDESVSRLDGEEEARRLARAIAADIKLYNAQSSPEDRALAVEEGRELYRARVASELLPLYDAALLEQGIAGASSASSAAEEPSLGGGVSPAPRAPASFFEEQAPKAASGSPMLAIAIAAIVLVALLAFLAR